jgi:transcription initiation factor TFIID TATA-box-binding protein
MTDVRIENIVVSFSIESSLDLPTLAGVMPDAKYNTDEAPTLVLEFDKPHAVATLLATGVVTVSGPRSMEEVSEVTNMVLDRLKVVNVQPFGPPEVTVQNVTASTHLNHTLRLRSLIKFLQHGEYQKKLFPGVVYTTEDPNTVILLFDSGKIVCNGNSIEAVTQALEKMVERLLSFGVKKEEKHARSNRRKYSSVNVIF